MELIQFGLRATNLETLLAIAQGNKTCVFFFNVFKIIFIIIFDE